VIPAGATDEYEAQRDHFVYTIDNNQSPKLKMWHIILDIKGRGLKAKVDTGATCNIMPQAAYRVLCRAPRTNKHLFNGLWWNSATGMWKDHA
jgi:hypothetical protein